LKNVWNETLEASLPHQGGRAEEEDGVIIGEPTTIIKESKHNNKS